MASFFSPYSHEFVRLGACVPHVAVVNPRQNADNVLNLLASGDKARIALMVFPELGISAYADMGEDLGVPHPPSTDAALAGAEILLNLSASNITIGKADMRRVLCASQASRCIAAYAYSAAGVGESTTDLAWDGQAGIFEIGEALAETERFSATAEMAIADIGLGRIRQERMRANTFGDSARAILAAAPQFRRV